jgi:hypothetical protein
MTALERIAALRANGTYLSDVPDPPPQPPTVFTPGRLEPHALPGVKPVGHCYPLCVLRIR